MDPLVTGALVTGLLGSGHCVGMCGGLVAALGLSGGRRAGLTYHILYNLGRIATYAVLGYLVGWLGLAVAQAGSLQGAGRAVMIGADLFVILIGLGTAGAFGWLNVMRFDLAWPVRALAAAMRRLRALPPAASALPLGLLLGFIPCGFLYSVLLTAALTAAPLTGAQVMIGFGLGTAPALLTFGGAANLLGARARGWMLRAAGLSVALMGAYNLWRHLHAAAGSCCDGA